MLRVTCTRPNDADADAAFNSQKKTLNMQQKLWCVAPEPQSHTRTGLKYGSFSEDKQTAATPSAEVTRFEQEARGLSSCKAAVERLFWLPEKQIRLLIYSVTQLLPLVTSMVYLPAEGNHRIRIKIRLCIPALREFNYCLEIVSGGVRRTFCLAA